MRRSSQFQVGQNPTYPFPRGAVRRASHLSICLSVHLSLGSSTLCTGGRSVRRRLQPKADEGRVRDRTGQQAQPSPAAQQIKPHFIVLSSVEKILLIPRLLAAIVDFQYSPDAVTIIVTFTKDYGQSTSTQKKQCSWFSLSQSIATKYINTLKLLYIQSIL